MITTVARIAEGVMTEHMIRYVQLKDKFFNEGELFTMGDRDELWSLGKELAKQRAFDFKWENEDE